MGHLNIAGLFAFLALGLAATVSAQDQQAGPPQRLASEQRQALVEKHRQALRARGAVIFQRLDKNGDGAIARDEWARAAQVFDRLDANKDGVLRPEELARARMRQQVRMRQMRAQMMRRNLRRWDVDNDGRISAGEWKGQPDRFTTLDSNHDGVLTREELRLAFARRAPRK